MAAMLAEAGMRAVARPASGPANSDAAPGLRAVRAEARCALERLIEGAREARPTVPVLREIPRLPTPDGGWTVEAWWASLDSLPRVRVVEIDPVPERPGGCAGLA